MKIETSKEWVGTIEDLLDLVSQLMLNIQEDEEVALCQ